MSITTGLVLKYRWSLICVFEGIIHTSSKRVSRGGNSVVSFSHRGLIIMSLSDTTITLLGFSRRFFTSLYAQMSAGSLVYRAYSFLSKWIHRGCVKNTVAFVSDDYEEISSPYLYYVRKTRWNINTGQVRITAVKYDAQKTRLLRFTS